mmetsp:Transcript_61595/g.133325  ORF Transcript_61595/g.133325 Transcript_61595/m.133325 type:complete len:228 (+) Transcript_61595:154-837(+)
MRSERRERKRSKPTSDTSAVAGASAAAGASAVAGASETGPTAAAPLPLRLPEVCAAEGAGGADDGAGGLYRRASSATSSHVGTSLKALTDTESSACRAEADEAGLAARSCAGLLTAGAASGSGAGRLAGEAAGAGGAEGFESFSTVSFAAFRAFRAFWCSRYALDCLYSCSSRSYALRAFLTFLSNTLRSSSVNALKRLAVSAATCFGCVDPSSLVILGRLSRRNMK